MRLDVKKVRTKGVRSSVVLPGSSPRKIGHHRTSSRRWFLGIGLGGNKKERKDGRKHSALSERGRDSACRNERQDRNASVRISKIEIWGGRRPGRVQHEATYCTQRSNIKAHSAEHNRA